MCLYSTGDVCSRLALSRCCSGHNEHHVILFVARFFSLSSLPLHFYFFLRGRSFSLATHVILEETIHLFDYTFFHKNVVERARARARAREIRPKKTIPLDMSILRWKLAKKDLRLFHVSVPTEIEHSQNDNHHHQHHRSDGNRKLTEDTKRKIGRERRKSSSAASPLSLARDKYVDARLNFNRKSSLNGGIN